VSFPDLWLYALGLMFILVTRYLPKGVFGLLLHARGQKP
jgi:urea transport system permease protein